VVGVGSVVSAPSLAYYITPCLISLIPGYLIDIQSHEFPLLFKEGWPGMLISGDFYETYRPAGVVDFSAYYHLKKKTDPYLPRGSLIRQTI
jgi:hypothetical protein